MKWEYRSYTTSEISDKVKDRRFEKWGQEGWELVGFHQDTAYFKRPIEAHPNPEWSEWWSISIRELPEFIHSVCVTPDAIFAGSGTGHIYKSDDRGRSWNTVHAGTLTQYPIDRIFTERRNTILAHSGSDILIGSNDNGLTWEYFEKND